MCAGLLANGDLGLARRGDGHARSGLLNHGHFLPGEPTGGDPVDQRPLGDIGDDEIVLRLRDRLDEVLVAGLADQVGDRAGVAAGIQELVAVSRDVVVDREHAGARVGVEARDFELALGAQVGVPGGVVVGM